MTPPFSYLGAATGAEWPGPRVASFLHVCGSPIDEGTFTLKIIPGLLTSRKAEEQLSRNKIATAQVQVNCEDNNMKEKVRIT